MTLDIETLTHTLSSYSAEANSASTAIANGLQPLGLVVLSIFFLIDFLSWKNILNKDQKKISSALWIEFAAKYVIGVSLVLLSSTLLDAIVEISSMITRKVASIYTINEFKATYEEADFGGWIINGFMSIVGWIIEKLVKFITFVLMFLRYIDLYFLKAIAPLIIGFYFSDEFRPVVMNLFKSFIAYSILSLALLVLSVIFSMTVVTDAITSLTTGDEAEAAFIGIVKGVAFIMVVAGAIRKVKSILGVQ